MPKVDLVATKDFSYATRRLKAGDNFSVDAPMARVLVAIGKAKAPREPVNIPAPPRRVVEQARSAAPASDDEPASKPVGAMTSTSDNPKPRRRRRRTAKTG